MNVRISKIQDTLDKLAANQQTPASLPIIAQTNIINNPVINIHNYNEVRSEMVDGILLDKNINSPENKTKNIEDIILRGLWANPKYPQFQSILPVDMQRPTIELIREGKITRVNGVDCIELMKELGGLILKIGNDQFCKIPVGDNHGMLQRFFIENITAGCHRIQLFSLGGEVKTMIKSNRTNIMKDLVIDEGGYACIYCEKPFGSAASVSKHQGACEKIKVIQEKLGV